MRRHARHNPRIAILGGGFAGAAVAWNLAEAGAWADITIIEPAAELGGGLAFSTREPAHRTNVPASQMSLRPEAPADFINWLEHNDLLRDGDFAADGQIFVQRGLFGRYVAEHLDPYLRDGTIRHARAQLMNVTTTHGYDPALRLTLSNGGSELADILVIATGNPMPEIPAPLQPLIGSDRLIVNPYDPAKLDAIARNERVLIVGSGLTSADVVATLDRRGHLGPILTMARRGLRSQPYGSSQIRAGLDFTKPAHRSLVGLLRHVRAAVRDAAARGESWQPVINLLRKQGQTIWAALDQTERARFTRHLQVYWDIHRHRVAPQIAAVLDAKLADGSLSQIAARLSRAAEDVEGVHIGFRGRGDALNVSQVFDRVIVATGPAHARAVEFNRGLSALKGLGLIAADPLGLGIEVQERVLAARRDAALPGEIFVAGALARGGCGELVGAPEIAAHAREIAARILALPNPKTKPLPGRGKTAARVTGRALN